MINQTGPKNQIQKWKKSIRKVTMIDARLTSMPWTLGQGSYLSDTLTGKSTKYLEDRAAEKKAKTTKEFCATSDRSRIEAKERAKTKRHEMNREKSRDEALRYLEVMRISDDTIELDFYNRKMGPDDCSYPIF